MQPERPSKASRTVALSKCRFFLSTYCSLIVRPREKSVLAMRRGIFPQIIAALVLLVLGAAVFASRAFATERLQMQDECTAGLRADCSRLECSTTGDVASATRSCKHCGACVTAGPPTCSPSMKKYCTNAECRWLEDLGRAECKGCEPCVTAPPGTQPTPLPSQLLPQPPIASPIASPITSPSPSVSTGVQVSQPSIESAATGSAGTCPAGSGLATYCAENGCATTGDVTARDECSACGPCVKTGAAKGCTDELLMYCTSPRRACETKWDLDSKPKVCKPCAPCIKATGQSLCGPKTTMWKHCELCVDLFKKKQLRRDLRETMCFGCDPCYRDDTDRF